MSRRGGHDTRRARQGRWRGRHREAWRGARRRLLERPWSHVFALGLLALALLMLLLLRLGADQFRHLGSPLDQARTLSLFLQPALGETAAEALALELQGDARVAAVERITPTQGLQALLHDNDAAEALAALPANPLPWVLAVDPVDRAAGAALAAQWQQRPEVDHLADDGEWHDRAEAVRRVARQLGWLLSALVGLATVLLVANAVRTLRVEGREERALQRVFGATEADLRRPYLYVGGLYGLIAGTAAVALAGIILMLLRPGFEALTEVLRLAPPSLPSLLAWSAVLPVFAAALGAFGAWVGCRFEPDLENT